jgi:AraC family transcriptional regulator
MSAENEARVRAYRGDTSMQPHAHEEASINVVVGGSFVEHIGRQDRNYAPGHIAYLPAGVVHSQTFGPAGARQIILRPRPIWLDYLSDRKARLPHSPHLNSPLVRQLGMRMLGELRQNDRFSAIAREGILLEIVVALGRDGTPARAGTQPPSWLRAAREFLRDSVAGAPSMKQLAQAVGRHEIHVAREFRRFYGESAGTYVRRLRTEYVAQLLSQPGPSIAAIALDCGFSSHSHLCREFKARFGVTPSQFRTSIG